MSYYEFDYYKEENKEIVEHVLGELGISDAKITKLTDTVEYDQIRKLIHASDESLKALIDQKMISVGDHDIIQTF